MDARLHALALRLDFHPVIQRHRDGIVKSRRRRMTLVFFQGIRKNQPDMNGRSSA